jgi:hypothetical protein
MTSSRNQTPAATQLQLPLPTPAASGAPRKSRGARRTAARRPSHSVASIPTLGDGQRLDEQTRAIGRRGIAAARALLSDGGEEGGRLQSEGGRGTAGRAA